METGWSCSSMHADGRPLEIILRRVDGPPEHYHVLSMECSPCSVVLMLDRGQLERLHAAIGQHLQDTDPQTDLVAAAIGG